MQNTPEILSALIQAVVEIIDKNSEEVMRLDQEIGDGDHVTNLQRGLDALMAQSEDIAKQPWPAAWKKIGMTLLTTMGGASGSLFGTLFIAMSKAQGDREMNLSVFADVFDQGVEAVKKRGKSDVGEKTMLDVLVPVALQLKQVAEESVRLSDALQQASETAIAGVESTKDMLATKGRASFLEERSLGHIDAGAKSSQLMICAIAEALG